MHPKDPHLTQPPKVRAKRALPKDANSAETRQRIILAAEKLFASKGLFATSIRDITTAANANLAAVNYHFSTKESLYIEVFQRRIEMMREYRIQTVQQAIKNTPDNLSTELICRAFALAFLEPLKEPQESRILMQLFMREMIDPHLPPGMFLNQMAIPMHQLLHNALTKVHPNLTELNTNFILHSFVGQLVHFAQLQTLFSQTEHDIQMLQQEQVMLDHIIKFTVAGIHAYAQQDAPPQTGDAS